MSLVFMDSFEQYGSDIANMLKGSWAALTSGGSGDITLVTTPVRTGTRALRVASGSVLNTTNARYALKASTDIIGVGYGLYMPNLPSTNTSSYIAIVDTLNIVIFSLSYNSDGSVSLYTGIPETGTLIETSDSYLTAGTYHHIEFRAFMDDTVGEFECRINGITAIQLGGLNLGVSLAKGVSFRNSKSSVTCYYDDLFVWTGYGDFNNDFLGPLRVLTVFADGELSPNDWGVTGAGTAHEAIDEIPADDDTSYVYADTIGDKLTLTLPELPPEIAAIAGVFIPVFGRIDEAGIGQINMSAINGGQSYYGGETTPLTTSYTYWPFIFEYDPNTETTWTKTGFEAAAIQIEKTA